MSQCYVCGRRVGPRSLSCLLCNGISIHKSCLKRSGIVLRNNEPYYCVQCSTVFPFANMEDDQLKDLLNEIEILSVDDLAVRLQNIDDISIIEDRNVLSDVQSQYWSPDEFINGVTGSRAKYSVLHLNCRSIRYKMDKLHLLLHELNSFQFDVIVLTETWLTKNDLIANYALENYTPFFLNRKDYEGGGVAIYVYCEYYSELIVDATVSEKFMETLSVKIMDSGRVLHVSAIYRPPSGHKQSFFDKLELIVTRFSASKYYVVGDFNLDLLGCDHSINVFCDIMQSYNLVPSVTKPTRITRTSATVIDNIFSNQIRAIDKSVILISDISDHLPICCIGKDRINEQRVRTIASISRNMAPYCVSQLKHQLALTNWRTVLAVDSLEGKIDALYSALNKNLDKCCPLKIGKQKINPEQKPWITIGIINSSKIKNSMYKKLIRAQMRGNTDVGQLQEQYRATSIQFSKLLRKAKKNYYETQFVTAAKDPKKTWELINTVCGAKVKEKISSVFTIKNEVVSDRNVVAEQFNKFFATIGETLSEQIPASHLDPTHFMPPRVTNTLFLSPVNPEEIQKYVQEAKPSQSQGFDQVSSILLKEIISEIKHALCNIINQSFAEGIFPSRFKLSKIIPVYKNGDKSNIENYRPISLLSEIGKVFEKCFYTRLIAFLNKEQILFESQYGFREAHSTVHALIDLVTTVKNSWYKKEQTAAIFLDLSKAFNTVNHSILCKKAEIYGVRGLSMNWLVSYLSGRQQYVYLEAAACATETGPGGSGSALVPNWWGDGRAAAASNVARCEVGVPQGSVLGSILFIIYINDMYRADNLLKYIQFADDTTVLCSSPDLPSLRVKIRKSLQNLALWLQTNQLTLNINKTKTMLFSKGKLPDQKLGITLQNEELVQVNCIKFLGIIVDSNLKWKDHVSNLSTKLASSVGILNKLKNLLPQRILKLIYSSLFLSRVLYGLEVWGFALKGVLKRVVSLQERCFKILGKCSSKYIYAFCKRANVLPFHLLFRLSVAKFMLKVKHKKAPIKIMNAFIITADIHDHNTRHSHDFAPDRLAPANTIFEIGPSLFNNLPFLLRDCSITQMYLFTKKYKQVLLAEL